MIHQAIHFATKAHEGQVRKVTGTPFIFHPLAVGCLLNDAGEDADTIIAGILHDTVEDTDVTLDDIRERFGEHIANLVAGVTENKTLSWERRKEATIDELQTAAEKVCIVTCADKIHNLQVSMDGIKEEGEDFFVHFKRGYHDQKWYYGKVKDVLERRIPNHPLFKMYKDVYDKVFVS